MHITPYIYQHQQNNIVLGLLAGFDRLLHSCCQLITIVHLLGVVLPFLFSFAASSVSHYIEAHSPQLQDMCVLVIEGRGGRGECVLNICFCTSAKSFAAAVELTVVQT